MNFNILLLCVIAAMAAITSGHQCKPGGLCRIYNVTGDDDHLCECPGDQSCASDENQKIPHTIIYHCVPKCRDDQACEIGQKRMCECDWKRGVLCILHAGDGVYFYTGMVTTYYCTSRAHRHIPYWAIALIVLACLMVICLLVACTCYFCRRRARRKPTPSVKFQKRGKAPSTGYPCHGRQTNSYPHAGSQTQLQSYPPMYPFLGSQPVSYAPQGAQFQGYPSYGSQIQSYPPTGPHAQKSPPHGPQFQSYPPLQPQVLSYAPTGSQRQGYPNPGPQLDIHTPPAQQMYPPLGPQPFDVNMQMPQNPIPCATTAPDLEPSTPPFIQIPINASCPPCDINSPEC